MLAPTDESVTRTRKSYGAFVVSPSFSKHQNWTALDQLLEEDRKRAKLRLALGTFGDTSPTFKIIGDLRRKINPETELLQKELARSYSAIIAEQNEVLDALRDGELEEKAEGRERVTRALTNTSRLIGKLTSGHKGERIFEPRVKKVLNQHGIEEKKKKRRWWKLWQWKERFDEATFDAIFNLGEEESRTDSVAVRRAAGLASVAGLRAIYHLGPGSLARVAVGLGIAQSLNTLLMSGEIGTLPHLVSWAVTLAPLAIRSIPRRINFGLIGKNILRSGVGALAGLGIMGATDLAVQAITGMPSTAMQEYMKLSGGAPLDLLVNLALANLIGRATIGVGLTKIGNISSWTEDFVHNLWNKQEMLTEVSRFAYWRAKEKMTPQASSISGQAERLAKIEEGRKENRIFGKKRGWSPIAVFLETLENSPEKMTSKIALDAAKVFQECRLVHETRWNSNPTRYGSEIFYDERNHKHEISAKFLRLFLNKQLERVFAITASSGWSESEKAEIFAVLKVTNDKVDGQTVTSSVTAKEDHAREVKKRADKLRTASLVAFAGGGALLGAGWRLASTSKNLVSQFHELSKGYFGHEVPLSLSRGRTIGSAVLSQGANEFDPATASAGQREAKSIALAMEKLDNLDYLLNDPKTPKAALQVALAGSGFSNETEARNYFKQLHQAGISTEDIRVVFQAAATKRTVYENSWLKSLAGETNSQNGNNPTLLARKLLSLDLRPNLANLVKASGLTPDIERTLGTGWKTERLLASLGLRMNDPEIQLAYYDLEEQASDLIKLGQTVSTREATTPSGANIKLALIGQSVLEIHPSANGSAEKSLGLLQTILGTSEEDLIKATTNPNVDYGRFMAVAYEQSRGQAKNQAEAVIELIRKEAKIVVTITKSSINVDNALQKALAGDPAAFNQLTGLMRDGSKKVLREFTGTGLSENANSVRLWRSVLSNSKSKNEVLSRAGHYFSDFDELWQPRIAVKTMAKTITTQTGETIPLKRIISAKPTIEEIMSEAYPEGTRPIIRPELGWQQNFRGGYFFDHGPYSEQFHKELLALEGTGTQLEYSGPTYLTTVSWRNLLYKFGLRDSTSGGSGPAMQITKWITEGHFGGARLEISGGPERFTREYYHRLLGAVFWEQVPPEIGESFGLPPSGPVPPIPHSVITRLFEAGINIENPDDIARACQQLEKRIIAETLRRIYGDDVLTETYLQYVPLGMVGGLEVRGVEAGARVFFGVSADQLSITERALLLGIAQKSEGYSPLRHTNDFIDRGKWVLKNSFLARGLITQEQYHQSLTELNSGYFENKLNQRFPNGKIPADLVNITSSSSTAPQVAGVNIVGEIIASPVAPGEIQKMTDYLSRVLHQGVVTGGKVTIPLNPDKPGGEKIAIPAIELGDRKSYPGISAVIIDETGGITEYNPSGIMGRESWMVPGSTMKPFILTAEIAIYGVDPKEKVPVWPGAWAIGDPKISVTNPPIYTSLNEPSLAPLYENGILKRSGATMPLDYSIAGPSANIPILAKTNQIVREIDPDADRKILSFLKNEFGLTVYDKNGREMTFLSPLAPIGDCFVREEDFVRAYNKLFNADRMAFTSESAKRAAQKVTNEVMMNDQLRSQTVQIAPGKTFKLDGWSIEAQSSRNLTEVQKTGTAADIFLGATPDKPIRGVGEMTLVKGIRKDSRSPFQVVLLRGAAQNIGANGKPIKVNLESVLGGHDAYAGVTLGKLARSLFDWTKKSPTLIANRVPTRP